jgi:hypothetical protein
MLSGDDRKEILSIVKECFKSVGFSLQIEQTFDFSQLEKPDLAREFIRLCDGKLENCIYISKSNNGRNVDPQFYDLLCVLDEDAHPHCLPFPIARKLFEYIDPRNTKYISILSGHEYERIFKKYYHYKKRNQEMTF